MCKPMCAGLCIHTRHITMGLCLCAQHVYILGIMHDLYTSSASCTRERQEDDGGGGAVGGILGNVYELQVI